MKGWRPFRVPVGAALALTALDQATKSWISGSLGFHDYIPVVPRLVNIVHVRNTGVAFGFLSGHNPDWVNPFLIAVTLLAVAAVLWYVANLASKGPAPLGLGLVLGGALGNLIDRSRLGYVVDFIDLHWGRYHWPAFNVADIGITVGVALLILDMLFWSKEEESAPRPR